MSVPLHHLQILIYGLFFYLNEGIPINWDTSQYWEMKITCLAEVCIFQLLCFELLMFMAD